MKLHIVNKSPFRDDALSQCLSAAKPGSVVLLLEDAVYAVVPEGETWELLEEAQNRLRVAALEDDVQARGLIQRLGDGVELVNYRGFARLAATCDCVVSWH